MGDTNNYQQGKDLAQQQPHYAGAGMDALISAIEYQGQNSASQSAAATSYPTMMANMQDHKEASGAIQSEEFAQAVAAGLYRNLQPGTLNANALWGLNPMLMTFPGLRPGIGIQTPTNLLPQTAVHGLPQSMHEMTFNQNNTSAHLGKRVEGPDAGKLQELSGLPFMYPGLHYAPQSGLAGLPGLTGDKVPPSVHEAAAKGLQYPTPSALNPYLSIQGYQSLLAGNAAGMLPSILPGGLNPAALGALGSYPYYQSGLVPRIPYLPQMGPNPMVRMPPSRGLSSPPSQSHTPEGPSLRPESPRSDARPQSGGYLPVKENLQRRISAPNPGSGTHFRMPIRNDAHPSNKPGVSYPAFTHRSHLPSQLIAPTTESNKQPRPRGSIDPKSIEQHISQLISQNAKILSNPTLDKVKPRRVLRRSSLDPASLSSPNPTHNPVSATHSAPRSLDPKYAKSLLNDKVTSSDRPNFLTVPPRNADSQNDPQSSRPKMTFIPDRRRDPHARPYIPTYPAEPQNPGRDMASTDHGQYLNRHESMQSETFRCVDCGTQFLKRDTYEAHKSRYCSKRPDLASSDSSRPRRSVIQYTSVPSTESNSSSQEVPEMKVTPPDFQGHHLERHIEGETMLRTAKLLENPMRHIHKDVHRAHSADAALQLPRRTVESEALPHRLSPDPRINPSPPKSDTSDPQKVDPSSSSCKSSIPTDKLPPKKKQLQLMRSNSSSKSQMEVTKSPVRNPSPLTSELSSPSQENKTPEETSKPQPAAPVPEHQKLQPPLSLHLDSGPSRKALPAWIPLEREEKGGGIILDPPPIYFTDPSTQNVAFPATSGSLLPSPTGKSPTSPKSPSRRVSPGRGSRSPSRSPTSSNLESSVPRSNYKLLLHQISLRNMQDMGYLSEAYHHSKDKNLKRNIASLLWSSVGTHAIEGNGNGATKRMRPFGPAEGPNMEELYPGKASLARRLSPDSRAARSLESGALSPIKTPLSHSRSRPYESTLKAHPSLTRSHSSHSHSYSSDVNNNIKQFLQNKSRQQQQASNSSSQPSRGHKPLTRTHANARYLLKSPTKLGGDAEADSGGLVGKSALETRKSVSSGVSSSEESTQRLKETLALKRAASYNSDSTLDYQSKRQKLKPITKQPTTTTHQMLPTSLVAPRLTEHVPTTSEVRELPKIKSVNPHTVQTPFLLHPHWSPSLGYDPHPTFCSLVSPQPMYVEHQQSTLSMYSQWAVSEPLLLPKGMTVIDMFENMRFLKGLSPYISYNSLFTTPSEKESFKLIETKEYESKSKENDSTSNQKTVKTSTTKSEEVTPKENSSDVDVKEKGDENNEEDSEEIKKWMFSRVMSSELLKTGSCFTSCHNKVSAKPQKRSKIISKTVLSEKGSKYDPSNDSKSPSNKFPKLPPPKVIIHPPSPESAGSDSRENLQNSSPKNNDIAALEFSDCDSDDDAIKGENERISSLEKSSFTPQKETPSSSSPNQSPVFVPISKPVATPDSPRPSPNSTPSGQTLAETANIVTSQPEADSRLKNDFCSDSESHTPLQIVEDTTGNLNHCTDNPSPKNWSPKRPKSVDLNHTIGKNGEVKSESSEVDHKKWRKIRKSRKERNATSPLLQKRADASPESPLSALEDPSLAVHPIGACSDDPAKICALCRMKAEGRKSPEDMNHHDSHANDNCNGKGETSKSDDSDSTIKPHSPLNSCDRPCTPNRPHTPTPRVRTPTSARPRTPVPLTVSVPKRSRDRASSKSGNQPLTPGILDKARGKGMTQHWVTTTDLQTSQPSPKQEGNAGNDEKISESLNSEAKNDKQVTKNRSYSSSEYYSTMPPNKNPVLGLSLQQKPPETSTATPTVASSNAGSQALAAVVSGVMMSAAIQSKKKTKSSKHEITELLSHSRPLIPTADLNGSANKARFPEKHKNPESEGDTEKSTENSLGSLANLTATVGPNATGSRGKPSLRHLSLSSREKELFLNKANETRTAILNERKVESDVEVFSDVQDTDDGHHSDGAKEDSLEADGESSNPRPHKCLECKVAFRIAGHLAKHLRSKGHIIAMQKKTLNRLKQQKLSTTAGQEIAPGSQGVTVSGSVNTSAYSPEANPSTNQEELLTQLGEGAETLAQAQVRALFEGNDEYAEINTGIESGLEALPEASDDEGDYAGQTGSSDPRPFKCIACKVAFRFQGHLDRHFRSNTHLLAVGHFGRDAVNVSAGAPIPSLETEECLQPAQDNTEEQEPSENSVPFVSENEREDSIYAEPSQNCDDSQKEASLEKIGNLDQNCVGIPDASVVRVEANSNQQKHQRLDDEAVNQACNDSDWSKQPSITYNNHASSPREPVNGLVSHSIPVLTETAKSDSLLQMSIKAKSPVIQSSAKKLFEATPTIPEMPLPSTSPVQKRQQLTC